MNTVIISSHVLLEGAAHALRDYLLKRNDKKLLFISLPLIDQRESRAEIYVKGKLKKLSKVTRKLKIGIFDYIIDSVWVFYNSIRFGKTDLFVGIDPLNAFVGIILKKIGYSKKVIYYGIDFVPIRFESKIINSLFHFLEAYCVKNSDEVWNVSDRIKEGRQKFLGIDPKVYYQKTVPIGVYPSSKKRIKNTSKVLFIGHLLKKQGVQKVIEALPEILKKIPKCKLIVVGGGEYKDALIRKTKQLGISNAVEFKGWIKDKSELESITLEADLAVACYVPEKEMLRNFSYYADPTKIKDYLNAGLPVVMTNVPHNASDIENNECGIIVKYEKRSIASAILQLLQDDKKLAFYQKNAVIFMKKYNWDLIFTKALNV